jgi:tRNA 2-selenouridine synthase
MPVQKLPVLDFLNIAQSHLLIDVRSPSEYTQAHIPHAISIPLFTDEERKIVGTNYKQESRENAIKIGLDFFGPKMRSIVEQVEKLLLQKNSNDKIVLVHCWRGGMRSAGVAWLLDLYGFKVYTLIGGYKAYRGFIVEQFERQYNINIIGGYTGSGKTYLIQALKALGKNIIDLEAIANHKGSALGGIEMPAQPTQEMFENVLGTALSKIENDLVFIEDESQRIGNMILPNTFWQTMRKSPVVFLNIPFEERLNFLTTEYGNLPSKELVTATMRIQKRLGGLETKNCINFLLENNIKEAFRILLKYYDKHYLKGLYNRENANDLIKLVETKSVDAIKNAALILNNI